ncbi:HK97 family phage prohead protease [Photobacterium satsumensis]|uniref:HK97 family phage prohead protease n=1 Tax=Photobacterium satsumensis TaxID=2910239 RepID=UPI003D14425F
MKNKSTDFCFKSLSDVGEISGYLNVFNVKDYAGDITLPGAFNASLQALKGRKLPMLYQHKTDEPIGVWEELREDSHGLYAVGKLNLEVTRGREAYALAKQGALTGISIGYTVDDESYDRNQGANLLKVVTLKEASLVTFPANDESRVDDVKCDHGLIEQMMNEIHDMLKAA